MVRRRATKAAALTGGGARSANSNLLENGELKSTVGCTHLDEQYFASPKRKDCKIDHCLTEKLANREHQSEKEVKTHGKTKSASASGKIRGERGGIAGRTIGVPLATRSQTRTIENFFKAKTAANNAKLEESSERKAETISRTVNEEYLYEDLPHYNNIHLSTPDTPCELDEDTNDSEFCAQLTEETVFGRDFLTHRSQLRDSHSSTSSACTNISNSENIFLQEPVLTLNVDKTPNQASSIKINTSLEVEPIFSSPPALTSALHGRFNQIVTLNISPCKLDQFSHEAQNMAIVNLHENDLIEELLPEQDNNNGNDNDNSSCDSGVAFTTTVNSDMLLSEQNDKVAAVPTDAGNTRRRKPATPHRIVCPSPIKTMPQVISPMCAALSNGRISSPSERKLNREHLSPRKSPRKMANGHSKTRRRLNTQKEFSTLNADSVKLLPEECVVAMNQNDAAKIIQHEINNCEKRDTVVLAQQQRCATLMGTLKQPQKPVAPKSHAAKMQTHKPKLVKGLPLAAANNNHTLKECFPVRRSVRKTKTAVNEEIMRNLERAILEECTDGLKVSHFEGKGRGVVADRHFQRGEFVVEYVGDLISTSEASEREKRYALDENAGCYMYYFKHIDQQYCIDATADTGKLGRLVNHSRNGNLVTKVVVVKQRPHLILVAKDDIEPGEELTYDYGDRSKESLLHHPWLAF